MANTAKTLAQRAACRRPVSSNPAQRLPNQQTGLYRRWGKHALDLGLVILSAPVWLLVTVTAAASIVMIDRHNPFYSQIRLGQNGQRFRMWKLRTMSKDADLRLALLLASDSQARDEWQTHQKLRDDPRITKTGAFLRKTSLDELPQLFNVLRGDMSLVGPRPIMECQRDQYPGEEYFDMRPGLTGLWQVCERNSCSFSERAQYDAIYASDQTLMLDLAIMLKTLGVVVQCTGR